MDGQQSIDWTQIIIAYAAPVFSFLGLVAQAVIAKKHKKDSDKRANRTNEAVAESSGELSATIEQNTKLSEQNYKLIQESNRLIKENTQAIAELKAKLSANDMATVSVVRQNIRRMYYELRPHKVISDADSRALNELYTAYKGVTLPDGTHPNSWCDHLYQEMERWEHVEVYPEHLAYLSKSVKERNK